MGHFPHVEKEMQVRLGKLHMKHKLRAYRAKARQMLKLTSPLIPQLFKETATGALPVMSETLF